MSLLSRKPNDLLSRQKSESNKLGELLIAAGILQPSKLPDALNLAKKSAQPIGRVLVMFNAVKQHDVDSALFIQKLIRDSAISKDLGLRALQTACESSTPIKEVLEQQGWKPKNYIVTNGLGELLVSAGLITRQQLAEAVRMSSQAGMPLGRYLALTSVVATPVVFSALDAQIALRDGKLSREQAIRELKTTAMVRTALPSNMFTRQPVTAAPGQTPEEQEIKLGELLNMAEIISESDVLAAVELGLFHEQPLGKVLIDMKLIPDRLLSPALRLQTMIRKREVRPAQAAQALMMVHRQQRPLEAVLEEMGLGSKPLAGWKEALELLNRSGLLSEPNFRQAVHLGEANSSDVARAILNSGCVDDLLFNAAVRCIQLLGQGRLRLEQAVIALHYCARSRNNLDEAIRDLSY